MHQDPRRNLYDPVWLWIIIHCCLYHKFARIYGIIVHYRTEQNFVKNFADVRGHKWYNNRLAIIIPQMFCFVKLFESITSTYGKIRLNLLFTLYCKLFTCYCFFLPKRKITKSTTVLKMHTIIITREGTPLSVGDPSSCTSGSSIIYRSS